MEIHTMFSKTIIALSATLAILPGLGAAKDLNLLPLSSLRVSDAEAYETCPAANPPIRHANFVVTLQRPLHGPFLTETVDFETKDGTALAGVNYVATSDTLTFAPGETTKQVTVNLLSSNSVGSSEFSLVLSNPSFQTGIQDFNGIASIIHLDSGMEECQRKPKPPKEEKFPDLGGQFETPDDAYCNLQGVDCSCSGPYCVK
jgi:hypothetical protein